MDAEDIVRALAAKSAPIEGLRNAPLLICTLCDAAVDEEEDPAEEHADTCPWLRAREWVAVADG